MPHPSCRSCITYLGTATSSSSGMYSSNATILVAFQFLLRVHPEDGHLHYVAYQSQTHSQGAVSLYCCEAPQLLCTISDALNHCLQVGFIPLHASNTYKYPSLGQLLALSQQISIQPLLMRSVMTKEDIYLCPHQVLGKSQQLCLQGILIHFLCLQVCLLNIHDCTARSASLSAKKPLAQAARQWTKALATLYYSTFERVL